MRRKPIVGVVADRRSEYPGIFVPESYMESLEAAGVVALTLPFARDPEDIAHLATLCDGYLLTGGADVNPRAYGAPTLACCGEVQPQRDAFELAFVPLLVAADKPIFAICRGIQALNVALGGTLHQDIDTQHPRALALQHRQLAQSFVPTHAVDIAPDSLLSRIMGPGEAWVNTFHHQAVAQLAPGLVPTAVAPDGVVEALEHPTARFILGVQWHPERMTATDEGARALFAAFAQACAQ